MSRSKRDGSVIYHHVLEICHVIDSAYTGGVTLHQILEGFRSRQAEILLHLASSATTDLIEDVEVSLTLQLIDYTGLFQQDCKRNVKRAK